MLTLAAGVGLSRGIKQETGIEVQLKWPNDLYLQDRKLGGILTESGPFRSGAGPEFVVIGVGVNVRTETPLFPSTLRRKVISLYHAGDVKGDIDALLTALVRTIQDSVQQLCEDRDGLLDRWRELDYLKGRVRHPFEIVESDPDAEFEAEYRFDVSQLEPMIAKPHTVDNVVPVSAVKGTKIDQVFFGSCTNARVEDFEVVTEVLRGKKVHPDVRMLVFPASREVYLEVLKRGWIAELVEAGCVIMNPGCGPCMGNHEGVPANGEVSLATSNRNFKGRLGNKESFVYLVSPRTAAVSALTGKIEDFRE